MGFLGSLFGPSREEIWYDLVNRVGGQYDQGGFFEKDVVRIKHGEWEIVLDEYTKTNNNSTTGTSSSTTYTRMRAPFINKDGLYFEIYRSSLFSPLGKMMGFQDIDIGDSYFDDDFVIKGNSEQQVKRLFADQNLRNLVYQQSDIHLAVRDDEGWFGADFPDGVDQLYFSAYAIRDVTQLEQLYKLFATVLERLVQIDSAYANDPNVQL